MTLSADAVRGILAHRTAQMQATAAAGEALRESLIEFGLSSSLLDRLLFEDLAELFLVLDDVQSRPAQGVPPPAHRG